MEYLLGQNTRDRLMRLLNNQGAVAALRAGPPRPSPAPWVVLRCTSATAIGGDDVRDQCYPAVLLDASSNEVAPLPELADCLLTVLGASGNSVAPTAGKVYAAILTGDVEGDGKRRPRAFAAEDETGGSAPTPVYGESTLGLYIIATDTTWLDSTLSITLPSAGTYLLECVTTVRASVSSIGSTGYIAARLWDVTNSAELDPADPSIAYLAFPQTTSATVRNTTTFGFQHVAAGAKTIRLEVFRGPNFTFSQLEGYTNSSVTRLRYRKL